MTTSEKHLAKMVKWISRLLLDVVTIKEWPNMKRDVRRAKNLLDNKNRKMK